MAVTTATNRTVPAGVDSMFFSISVAVIFAGFVIGMAAIGICVTAVSICFCREGHKCNRESSEECCFHNIAPQVFS